MMLATSDDTRVSVYHSTGVARLDSSGYLIPAVEQSQVSGCGLCGHVMSHVMVYRVETLMMPCWTSSVSSSK